jgi:probable HAF family extracellular repeat protein
MSDHAAKAWPGPAAGFIVRTHGAEGARVNIGNLGCGYSQAAAINDEGDVVGSSLTGNRGGITHAFLYSNGVMQDLGSLGGMDARVSEVNSSLMAWAARGAGCLKRTAGVD